jgi:hypothetical protein
MNFRQKIKIKNKKNALLPGHKDGVPCCPVSRTRIEVILATHPDPPNPYTTQPT